MNEIELSNNLDQIELEINHHKQIAGNSIWEIGRRLNHVKENDLSHGKFSEWSETIGIDRRAAHKFIKVANELPNDSTFSHLGTSALYLIATLPEEEREKEHLTSDGKAKQVDAMTVRELQELKKEIKQKDETIKELDDMVKNQKPKIVEKEVVKEVKPHDYDGMKSDNQQLSQALKEEQKNNEATLERLKQENEELKKANKIQTSDNDYQEQKLKRLKREAEISVYQITVNIQSFLREQALTDYHLGALANSNDQTKKKMQEGVQALRNYANDLEQALSGQIIFEED